MMMTRCPACRTGFRVTPEQLKARAGRVRCGKCNTVFNALEFLQDAPSVPDPSASPTPATPATPATTPALPAQEPGPETQPVAPVSPPPAPPPAPPAAPPAASPATQPATPAGIEKEPVAPVVAEADLIEPGFTEILVESVDFYEPAKPALSRTKTFIWSVAGILALCLLGLQATYLFRAELALARPELRPALEKLCVLLECRIALPRKADLVSIEASDLHPDPQQKNLLVLTATLKNRAPFTQDYPSLELTLTDAQDQPILRKVFEPRGFLAQGADLEAGFAAEGELAVNLWLDPGDLQANGYRLYLFYP